MLLLVCLIRVLWSGHEKTPRAGGVGRAGLLSPARLGKEHPGTHDVVMVAHLAMARPHSVAGAFRMMPFGTISATNFLARPSVSPSSWYTSGSGTSITTRLAVQ